MKPKKSVNHLLGSRFTFSASPLSLGIGIVAAGMALLATYTAHAASQTWDGGASTTSLNDANNWTNNLLPSASGDTGTWDATVPGALSLTWSTAGFGSTTNGFNVNIASGHTGTLRLDAAGTSGALSLGTITIANGAGAFSLGDGAGTANVTLRGTNTFTNNDNDTATINSDVFFASGGGTARTVTFAGTGNWDVYDGFALSGSGSIKLAKLGAGTLTLNAAGSYSGGTDIGTTTVGSAAVVRAAATQALGSGTLAILGNDGNNRLELSGGISLNNALTLSGRSTAGQAAILNVSGNNTFSGLLTMTTGGNQYAIESASGTLALTNTGTSTFLDSNRVLTFQGAGNGSFDGTLAGSGGLTKAGTGTWTLTGANSYSGATNVNAGTLAFTTNAQSLGSSVLSVADGAGLSVKAASAGSTLLTTGNLTLGTSGATSLTFDFNNLNTTAALINSGVFTVNGTVGVSLLNGAALASGTHALIDYTSFSGSGTLPAGSISLGARSSGTLVNDLTNTVLNLDVISDMPKWTGSDSGAWVVGTTGANSNWKLVTGGTATDYIEGDVVLFDDSAAGTTSITIDTNVSAASTTFNNSTLAYTVGGTAGIAGAGSLTKSGTGSLTLNTANSYTGGTTVNGGTVVINSASSLGATSGALTLNNGTLQSTADITTSRNVTLGHANSAISTHTNTTYAASGVLSGSGSLNKDGAGTLTLSGANTFTGDVEVNNGTLNASAASALGNPSLSTRTITVGTGTSLKLLATNVLGVGNTTSSTPAIVVSGGTLQIGSSTVATQTFNSIGNLTLNGASVLLGSGFNANATAAAITTGSTVTVGGSSASTISAISGATNAAIKLGNNSPAANSQITFDVGVTGATADLIVSAALSNGLNIGGTSSTATGLIKTGAGSMVLSGTNTYTGPTNVNNGTLVVNGNISTSSLTTVNGGTLQGSGTVGNLTVTSGIVAPGNSIESLGAGNVTFGGGGTYAYELDSDVLGGDLLYSSGALNITSGATLTLAELASGTLSLGSKLTLISYTGAWNNGLFEYLGGTLEDDSVFTLGANQWQFNYNDIAGGLNFSANQGGASGFVTMTVIPEPGAALLGGIGMLVLLRRRR